MSGWPAKAVQGEIWMKCSKQTLHAPEFYPLFCQIENINVFHSATEKCSGTWECPTLRHRNLRCALSYFRKCIPEEESHTGDLDFNVTCREKIGWIMGIYRAQPEVPLAPGPSQALWKSGIPKPWVALGNTSAPSIWFNLSQWKTEGTTLTGL